MFEKVNPSHPDKLADRIAGAIVDLAYRDDLNPKVAVEVLLGHGKKEAFRHFTSPTVGSPLIPPVEPLLKNIKRGRISLQERIKGGILMVRQ